jgi:hypothetical protein
VIRPILRHMGSKAAIKLFFRVLTVWSLKECNLSKYQYNGVLINRRLCGTSARYNSQGETKVDVKIGAVVGAVMQFERYFIYTSV